MNLINPQKHLGCFSHHPITLSPQYLITLRPLLRKFVNLLLFGNFWIAAAAVAMTWQTEYLLYGELAWTPLTTFVFSATLFLYAIHRIVGLVKVKPFLEKYRYAIIYRFRNHIKLYAFLGGVGALVTFFYLSFANQLLLIIPAILSLGYVLPFVKGQKRLRDFDYIKIFLIAIVWGVITVVMPILERGLQFEWPYLLLLLERMFFVFAITLPFDIRDLKIDAHIDVKTIPAILGIIQTKRLAATCLLLVALLAGSNYWLGTHSLFNLLAIGLSVFSTYLLVNYSDKTDDDYFFTGVMDGTMIVQFLLVWSEAAFL
ncbi:MAG: UbiA family prenyltransferase [Bacteroidota bacterium]